MDFLSTLNSEQKRAVETTEGPLIINAGPGTGKTKTLISRIQYLISQKNISPSHILALTFTQKSAAEMRERLQTVSTSQPLITTFHSLGYDILSSLKEKLTIISEKDRGELIRKIVKDTFSKTELKSIPLRELLLSISMSKNSPKLQRDDVTSQLLDLYNQELQKLRLLDFDDLLMNTFTLLQNDEKKRTDLQQRFQYILIDEFQDTNTIQYELIKQILNPQENLFVIGDPFQSIYSFRGANSEIFNAMKKDFPDHKEITLTINYRSVPEVITASSQLFPNAIKLQPHSQESGKTTLIQTLHEFTEAEWIVNEICNTMGGVDLLQSGDNTSEVDGKANFSDFAVMYRTHQFSRVLEQKFHESGIPYQIVGGNSPYEQSEVEVIINCLSYLYEKNDDVFKEILDSPIFKLSKQDSKKAQSLQVHSLKTQPTLSKTVHHIIETLELFTLLKDKPHKLKNIHQFQNTLLRFDKSENGLEEFLNYYKYLQEHEFYDPNSDKVTLLTIHAAKGLEFEYVYICGFEEGSIPFAKAHDNDSFEEEKRLLYVAMTRAKKGLSLIFAKKRAGKENTISRFKTLLSIDEREDEATARIEKWKQKQKDKKSQMTLF